MRASVVVLGPLLARWGHARVPLPGRMCHRCPPDRFSNCLKALAALGPQLTLEHGGTSRGACPAGGCAAETFTFDKETVTGTENVMMAATLAEGRGLLFENCAREPEVGDLAAALARTGGPIEGAGTHQIRIDGVDRRPAPSTTRSSPTRYSRPAPSSRPARERRGPGAGPGHMESLVEKLRATGAAVTEVPGGLRVAGDGPPPPGRRPDRALPGFATDMQAQMMVLLALADGSSVITETVFENRFMHVLELQRLGAEIAVDGKVAVVKGVPSLSGAPVMATTCAPRRRWCWPAWLPRA